MAIANKIATIVETGTTAAACPTMTLTLGGVTSDAYDTWAALTTTTAADKAYTDKATASMTWTIGAKHAGTGTGGFSSASINFMYLWGSAITAAATPTGAYSANHTSAGANTSSAAASTLKYCAAPTTAAGMTSATCSVAIAVGNATTAGADVYENVSGTTWPTSSSTVASAFASAVSLTTQINLPVEGSDSALQDATTGDRLNTGDMVAFLTGVSASGATATPATVCSVAAGVELELGAATLALAGSLTLVAALAI